MDTWCMPHSSQNNHEEAAYLTEVAHAWQTLLALAKVTHSTAEFELWQVILQKLEYLLVAMTFTRQQCNSIMKPILSAGLPVEGLVRLFPHAIVHGPWQWGGLNILNLSTEQLITHIHNILKFSRQLQDMTGSLRQALYKALWLESGLSGNICNFPNCIYEYVTNTWFSQMCKTCKAAQLQIKGMNIDFTPPRAHDVELMCLCIWVGYWGKELAVLNHCQMYTRTIYLSDLCNATVTKLEQPCWTQLVQCESPSKWPDHPKPTPHGMESMATVPRTNAIPWP